MGKVKLYLLFLGLLPGLATGQALSVKQFLKSALDNAYYKSFDAQQSFLQNKHSYALPWLGKVQVLYQDNVFYNYQNRYSLRFATGNPWQIYRNSQYFQGVHTLRGLEQKMVLKEILRERYIMLIEFWTAFELADLAFQQKEVQEQLANVLTKKAGSTSFDADQFLDSQLNTITKEADWHQASFDRDVARANILATTNANSFVMPLASLISLDQINQLIRNETEPTNRTEFELLKQRVEVSSRKVKLERSNIDIGYLQGVYNSDTRAEKKNNLGLSMALTIPITNPNKEDVAREKLNGMEWLGKLEQYKVEESSKRRNAAIYLDIHLKHYQKLDSLITAVKNRKMSVLTGLANNYDPVTELKYQEKLIQLELLKTRIKNKTLLQYIDYLDISDKLHQRPLINYLSGNLETLEDR